MKQCKMCGNDKPLTRFYKQPRNKDGLDGTCIDCRSASQKKRESTPEGIARKKERALRWYYKKRDLILGRPSDPEKEKEYQRRYRDKDRDSWLGIKRRYKTNHAEEVRAQNADYRKTHKAEKREEWRRYRARKMQSDGCFTQVEWESLCRKYDYRCLCCGRDDVRLTADHVVPLALGGRDDIENIQPLCQSCNSKKATKTTDYRLTCERGSGRQ